MIAIFNSAIKEVRATVIASAFQLVIKPT